MKSNTSGKPPAFDEKYTTSQLLRRLLNYMSSHKKALFPMIGFVLLANPFHVLRPAVVALAFDAIEAGETRDLFIRLVLIYVAVHSLSWIFGVAGGIARLNVMQAVLHDIREDAYRSIHLQDMVLLDNQGTGKLMSRITNDTRQLDGMIMSLMRIVRNAVMATTAFVLIFMRSWQLALLVLVLVPFSYWATRRFSTWNRDASKEWQASIASINAAFQESMAGISVAKAFGQEDKSIAEFSNVNKDSYLHAKRMTGINVAVFPAFSAMKEVVRFALLLVGVFLVVHGYTDNGTILLAIMVFAYFLDPLMVIAMDITAIQSGFSAMERIFSLIDTEPTISSPQHAVHKKLVGKISFEAVDFEYVPGTPVLRDVSFSVAANESVAIVGHTGAGKTTIASLVLRFYDANAGSISIDDIQIRDYDLDSLRSQIGLVSQNVFLFNGTVLENIKYGRPEATEAEITKVLDSLSSRELFDVLPEGLHTTVGERGRGLSIGQRHMIAFARTLLTDPRILILDEATASVDPYTEALIQEGLEHLLQNRTAITIAHRLTTVRNADRIIVLDKGQIVEEGSHDDLLAKEGQYAQLYKKYFHHQSEAWIEEIGEVFAD